MKTIGLVGGMSWESSAIYYEQLNRKINAQLGGLHSAQVILYSVDFHRIAALQKANQWEEAGEILAQIARTLENANVDAMAICTNTMHKLADDIQSQIQVPLLHIADASIEALQRLGVTKAGLLGTAFTMEQDFYRSKFIQQNIELIVPDHPSRAIIHNIIYDELCQGIIQQSSKQQYLNIIENLKEQGAEAIILGCTEIGLLIQQADVDLPVLDTTLLHVDHILKFMLDAK